MRDFLGLFKVNCGDGPGEVYFMPTNFLARIVILLSVSMGTAHASHAVDPKYGHLPVHFEPNLGQATEQVR